MRIVKRDHLKRVSVNGVVHFAWGLNHGVLCGCAGAGAETDLFGNVVKPLSVTSEPVNCKDCARLYCEIKNQPWYTVDASKLMDATFNAFDCETPEIMKKGKNNEMRSEGAEAN